MEGGNGRISRPALQFFLILGPFLTPRNRAPEMDGRAGKRDHTSTVKEGKHVLRARKSFGSRQWLSDQVSWQRVRTKALWAYCLTLTGGTDTRPSGFRVR